MSFNEFLDDLKAKFEADAALDAFCNLKWSKGVTVLRVFRERVEIAVSDLPIILITAPENQPGRWTNGAMESTRKLVLFCGFHQDKRELVQAELTEFEEKIEDVILSYRKQNIFPPGIEDVKPGLGVNDQGRFPPNYFLSKIVDVDATRETGG